MNIFVIRLVAENILSFGLGQTDYTFVSFSFAFQNILMSSHVFGKIGQTMVEQLSWSVKF